MQKQKQKQQRLSPTKIVKFLLRRVQSITLSPQTNRIRNIIQLNIRSQMKMNQIQSLTKECPNLQKIRKIDLIFLHKSFKRNNSHEVEEDKEYIEKKEIVVQGLRRLVRMESLRYIGVVLESIDCLNILNLTYQELSNIKQIQIKLKIKTIAQEQNSISENNKNQQMYSQKINNIIFKMPHITRLQIQGEYNCTDILASSFSHIDSLKYLQTLVLLHLNFQNQVLSALLLKSYQIKRLQIKFCCFKISELEQIQHHPRLQALVIGHKKIKTSSMFQFQTRFSKSQSVEQSQMLISHLPKQLNFLELHIPFPLHSLNKLIDTCSNVEIIKMVYCPYAEIVQTIISRVPKTESFDFVYNHFITHKQISQMVDNNLKIKHLKISYCQKVNNKFLKEISNLSTLQQLQLHGTSDVLLNKGFVYLKKLKNLKILDISDYWIGDNVVYSIVDNNKRMWKVIVNFIVMKKRGVLWNLNMIGGVI